MSKTHFEFQEVSDDRFDAVPAWRLELLTMGRVIRFGLLIALLVLTGFACWRQLVLPLIVTGGLLLMDVFCRHLFRRLDAESVRLQGNDLPLNVFGQTSFEALARRNPVMDERVSANDGVGRGRDLRALNQATPD